MRKKSKAKKKSKSKTAKAVALRAKLAERSQLSLFAAAAPPRPTAERRTRAKLLGLADIPVRSNGTATSDAAAAKTRFRSGSDSLVILELIEARGGLTCDEVIEATGISHETASARVNGLMNAGRVVDSGLKRKTRKNCLAIVWKVPAPAASDITSTNRPIGAATS